MNQYYPLKPHFTLIARVQSSKSRKFPAYSSYTTRYNTFLLNYFVTRLAYHSPQSPQWSLLRSGLPSLPRPSFSSLLPLREPTRRWKPLSAMGEIMKLSSRLKDKEMILPWAMVCLSLTFPCSLASLTGQGSLWNEDTTTHISNSTRQLSVAPTGIPYHVQSIEWTPPTLFDRLHLIIDCNHTLRITAGELNTFYEIWNELSRNACVSSPYQTTRIAHSAVRIAYFWKTEIILFADVWL